MDSLNSLFLWLCFVYLLSSCNGRDEPDQPGSCSSFLFSLVSARDGQDLVFRSDPFFDIETLPEKIVLCVEQPSLEVECGNTSAPLELGKYKIGNKDVLHFPACEVSTIVWEKTWITMFDTLTYAIDYKLPAYEVFKELGDRERYFEELYINGVLQCAPCEPEHVTVFEVDI